MREVLLSMCVLATGCTNGFATADVRFIEGGVSDLRVASDAGVDQAVGDAATDAGPSDLSLNVINDASVTCPATYATNAGCTTFEDRTALPADRTIMFTNFVYTPNCIEIKVGQQVTFDGRPGSFFGHPLRQRCGAEFLLFVPQSGLDVQTFTFNMPGDYGYYCLFHGTPDGIGMTGVIRVVP